MTLDLVGWLVGCIGVKRHFNSKGHIMAVCDAYVFLGFLTPVLTKLFFPKPPPTFPTCFCRDERRKYAGKKVASTGDRTRNHQVMSPTRSPLNHPGGANDLGKEDFKNIAGKGETAGRQHFLLFPQCFLLVPK